jgi:hypothetical protein
MNTTIANPNQRPATTAPWRRGLAIAALGGALALSLGGCAVVPAHPRFVGEVVLDAPPPAQAEVIGVAPAPGYVWIGGYWNWVGGRHTWVTGHWAPPRAGYYWVPHVWIHTGAGWHLREGHWARR